MAMNEQEAEAVILEMEDGRMFIFEAYVDGSREVLAYERATGRFVHRVDHAYDPAVEQDDFDRDGFKAHLVAGFEYRSFELPSVAGAAGKGKGGGVRVVVNTEHKVPQKRPAPRREGPR